MPEFARRMDRHRGKGMSERSRRRRIWYEPVAEPVPAFFNLCKHNGKLERLTMKKMIALAMMGALAGVFGSAQAAGDAAAGKAKAATCAGCHGSAGVSNNPLWPNLAGQKDQYLVKQLKAFRDGARKDPMMSPMAAPLSDQDIENLAAYFSGL
jgi:cytochrome c553